MSDLVSLLSPSYTDEEQVGAKQIQKGYSTLRDQMRSLGRLVVTVHGRPEAVLLPYHDVKLLWTMISDLIEKVEDASLVDLAKERLRFEDRIPLEDGLREMRRLFLETDSK